MLLDNALTIGLESPWPLNKDPMVYIEFLLMHGADWKTTLHLLLSLAFRDVDAYTYTITSNCTVHGHFYIILKSRAFLKSE